MKQSISFILVLTFMFIIAVPVQAKENCDFDKEKSKLNNLQIKANYKEDSIAYTVTMKNIGNDFYVMDTYGYKYEPVNNVVEINPLLNGNTMYMEGKEYRFSIFGSEKSSCSNAIIYEFNAQSLVSNRIKDEEICSKNPDFYLCNKYIYVEDSGKDFMTEFNNKDNSFSNYNKDENSSIILKEDYEKVVENVETTTSTFIIRAFIALGFLIILILIFIKFKKQKSSNKGEI